MEGRRFGQQNEIDGKCPSCQLSKASPQIDIVYVQQTANSRVGLGDCRTTVNPLVFEKNRSSRTVSAAVSVAEYPERATT